MALDIVKQIKDTILGVKSNKIDEIIDDSLEKIDRFSASEDQNRYLDSMKKLISSTGTDGNSVLKSLSTGNPQVQTYDTSGRINRYNEYDAICAKIPYCERALQCWVDHIVSPDEILKTSLQVAALDKDVEEDAVNVAIGRIRKILKHFDFENRIRQIVKTTLKKGDNFIEFVKTPNGANTLVVLNESFDPAAFGETKDILNRKYIVESIENKDNSTIKHTMPVRVIIDEAYSNFNLGGLFTSLGGTQVSSPSYPSTLATTYSDASGFMNSNLNKAPGSKMGAKEKDYVPDDKFKSKFDKIEKDASNYDVNEPRTEIGDLSIVVHDPKYVIRLETRRFKVCLGYLVFPKVDLINVQSGVVNNIDAMCAQLLNDVRQKLASKIKIDDKINITDDIKKVLLTHLQKIDKNEDLRIRYVNPDLMQHFKIDSTKNDPYGESIFESVLFSCRMYMALKTAATVKQINACTDKRFISLEVGLPRDAQNIINQMKESINKKRITVDSLGNTDTIPSQISTWENIFIPMKDGKKYVEIDHQQWTPNANEDNDMLKNFMNDIIGNLGVPNDYLNMESSGNRSTLTAESIQWARNIIARQQDLAPCLQQFIYKAYCILWGVPAARILRKISITFQIPRIAPMNINTEYIENSQRAIDALSALGLSKEYLKRQYMPYIDWERAETDAVKQKLNQETGEEAAENDMGLGGMGMIPTGGGGMGGMM